MLRMYLLQVWFSLSDEGVEDAIYDSYAMRRFMGLDFAVEQVPDATTLLHFRHLLEEHHLGEKLLAAQNEVFAEQGWIMRGGSIIDATIIAAPSSTKNATGDPRPADAPDEEGQPVVLRDEGPHRSRCREWVRPHRHGHGGECA
jgi:IS5 family transposase